MTEQAFLAGVILGVLCGAAMVLGSLAALSGHRPRTYRTLPVGTRRAIVDDRRPRRLHLARSDRRPRRLHLARSDRRRWVVPAADTFDYETP